MFDVASVLVQLSTARQGSPLNNLQLSSFFFFLNPVPTPSSQHPPDLPLLMWNVACLHLEPFHTEPGFVAGLWQVFVDALQSPRAQAD